jgi:hypothetical protein
LPPVRKEMASSGWQLMVRIKYTQLNESLCFIFSLFKKRFFSNLVEESLVNFQLKISQVMRAVDFTFNDFDFVINPLQFTGMDWIFTMVQDAIAMVFKHFYEAV